MPAAARRIWRSVEGRGSSVVVRCMDLAVFCKPEYDVRPAKARRILYGSQVIVTTQTALGGNRLSPTVMTRQPAWYAKSVDSPESFLQFLAVLREHRAAA